MRRICIVALSLLVSLPALAVLGGATAGPAFASGPTVIGSGSSYAAVALDQWVAQMAAFYGDSINYQTSSSVLGLNDYAQGQLNFAASEIGYSTGQSAYTPTAPYAPYQYLPDVAGATCLMYNLKNTIGTQITNLQLDAPTLLQIFTGQIQTWNNSAIQALNPGVALPDTSIIKAYRSDPSGENYIFSDYFSTLYPTQWNAFTAAMGTPSGPQAIFPTPSNGEGGQHGAYDITGFEGQAGSDVASEFVNDNVNSITYVETAYALRLHQPCVALENPAGKFVAPSEEADAIALTQDELEPDLEQILTGVFLNANPASYPISAYSYLIMQENGQPSAAIGAVLGQFVQFIACRGQQAAGTLGYSPLPPNLVADDFAAVNRLNGATQLPAPTAANCPNPYLTGALTLPGEPIQVTGPSGGGGATGSGGSIGSSGSTGTIGSSGGGTTSSGLTVAGGTITESTTGGTAGGAQSVATQAAVAKAAAEAAKVSAASKRKGDHIQIRGLAESAAANDLGHQRAPDSQIWFWVLVLLGVFVAVPLVVALIGRRRRNTLDHNPFSEVAI
jgi:phosphate transport system substrate-binding protein